MDNSSEKSKMARPAAISFGTIWGSAIALASVSFLILTASGWMKHFAEWQFAQMGFYSPLAPMVLLTAFFGVLGYALAALLNRRSKNMPLSSIGPAQWHLRQWRYVFLWATFASSLFALVAAVQLLQLPVSAGPPKVLLATKDKASEYAEGSIVLKGFSPKGQMMRFTQGFLKWKQDIYLVPLSSSSNPDAPIDIFAQVSESAAKTAMPKDFSGVLQHNALPDQLLPLATQPDLSVSPTPAVIFLDKSAMAYGRILTLVSAGLIAILAGTMAFSLGRMVVARARTHDETLHTS